MVIWGSEMVSEYNPISVVNNNHTAQLVEPSVGRLFTEIYAFVFGTKAIRIAVYFYGFSSQFRDALWPDVSLTSI